MKPFNWTCPHCNRATTITDQSIIAGNVHLDIPNAEGKKFACTQFIVCPNSDCKKFTLEIKLTAEREKVSSSRINSISHLVSTPPTPGKVEQSWRLIPSSRAKVFPSYIPQAIIDDYIESCLILNLSPKASATLARRCLQGMIRDFWTVKPARLVDEIEAIKSKVDPLIWEAIDSVRKVGNIGAHMEKNINLIIDVEPNEAELLINLIETLFNEWYIARKRRETQLKQLKHLATTKIQAKKNNKTS